MAEQKKERDRIYALKEKRGLLPKAAPIRVQSENDMFAEQIISEIEDRRQHLEEMRRIGGSKAMGSYEETKIKNEMATKILELKKYQRENGET